MRFIRLLLTLIILGLIGFGAFIYFREGSLSLAFFEKDPPTITTETTIGLGI